MRKISRLFSTFLMLCLLLGASGIDTHARQRDAERPLPGVTWLPVGADDVVTFTDGMGVDRQSTVLPSNSGGFLLVYSRFEQGDMDTSRLMIVTSKRGNTVSPPSPMAFGNRVEDAPAFITIADGTWLYFASSDQDLSNIKLWRASIMDGTFGSSQRLADIEGLRKLNQWPRWVSAGDEVLVTFRGRGSAPTWLRLSKGVTPGESVALIPEGVAYPRVVPMQRKGCFFSYQRPPEGGYMATWYRVSRDCLSWSSSIELSRPKPPNKPDVHDAYALPRRDGGVDVYYVYPSYKGKGARFPVGFDLYRRSVMADGTAGPEQLLTERARFNPFAPAAHRLTDGTILVTFSDIQENGENGVKRANLTLFKLRTDAPPPAREGLNKPSHIVDPAPAGAPRPGEDAAGGQCRSDLVRPVVASGHDGGCHDHPCTQIDQDQEGN